MMSIYFIIPTIEIDFAADLSRQAPFSAGVVAESPFLFKARLPAPTTRAIPRLAFACSYCRPPRNNRNKNLVCVFLGF